MLHCKRVQNILTNQQRHIKLITALLYPFSVACENYMTKLLMIQKPRSYFVDFRFFVPTQTLLALELKFCKPIVGLEKEETY